MIDFLYSFTIQITIAQRKRNTFGGRFGGGWNWELGLQIGRSESIINLLVLSIRIGIKSDKRAIK